MSIGQELLDVPFPDMIYKMANAIAQGQRKLDKASLDTARALAKAKVKVIPDIYEIVEKKKLSDALEPGTTLPGDAGDTDTIAVRTEAAKAVDMTLMQAGLLPTFYQFTESLIEVKVSISHRSSSSREFEAGAEFEISTEAEAHGSLFGFGGSASVSTTFASHVNYKSSSTYDYSAEGSSLLRTTLKPVPAPPRIIPRIVTIDATVTPPKVTFGA
ncbi:MAG TPA: hypothetical protein VE084_16335 [Burkholderiaceae bacterium]|nr:hypothetical protein [Pseudomonadota bacterium]MDQ7974342.1 hypothetical protein [Rhodocyclaceae bacterium]MDQ8002550.1 hypothetical protein [Pseudomonadota bacterium]MDQ8018290.1 hypothetical protein [Pseudomonadota bacterium]HZF85078.1 hypothetical protein [Burkholderiaceae bacterium]